MIALAEFYLVPTIVTCAPQPARLAAFQPAAAGPFPSPKPRPDACTSTPGNSHSRPTLPECGTNILCFRRLRGTDPKPCGKPRRASLRSAEEQQNQRWCLPTLPALVRYRE